MKVIEPSYEILFLEDGVTLLKRIETIGRKCYKSEEKITEDSYKAFVHMLVHVKHHEAMIEFADMAVCFIVDRGVTHEMVRHRLVSFAQESTRYCNYAKDKHGSEITVIRPPFWEESSQEYGEWKRSCEAAEQAYMFLVKDNKKAQEARDVLPNSLKTEIVMKANLREWRHIFKLRTSKAAHPQMRQVMIPLLKEVKARVPIIFDDIVVEE